jgi:hypothetical protein
MRVFLAIVNFREYTSDLHAILPRLTARLGLAVHGLSPEYWNRDVFIQRIHTSLRAWDTSPRS